MADQSSLTSLTKDTKNIGLYLDGPGKLAVRPCPMPELPLSPDAVFLRVDYVGICGSDLSLLNKGELASWKLDPDNPIILGHEPSGTVLAVGSGVGNLLPGDRVAVEHQMSDMSCDQCKRGRYNLCSNADQHTIGFPPTHGAIRRFMTHPAKWCYKIPDGIEQSTAAMVQPLAVAIHACNRANIRAGEVVLVTGAGPIGLLALQSAKAFAASRVISTDIIEGKLDLALELGADAVLNVTGMTADEAQAKVIALLGNGSGSGHGGREADVAIECSGAPASIELAIKSTRAGGKVVLCGIGAKYQSIPLTAATMREVDLLGVCRFANCYERALELMEAGRYPHIKKMITHVYRLSEEEAPIAFQTLQNIQSPDGRTAVKVMIKCSDDE